MRNTNSKSYFMTSIYKLEFNTRDFYQEYCNVRQQNFHDKECNYHMNDRITRSCNRPFFLKN